MLLEYQGPACHDPSFSLTPIHACRTQEICSQAMRMAMLVDRSTLMPSTQVLFFSVADFMSEHSLPIPVNCWFCIWWSATVDSACGGLQLSLLCALQARFGSGTGGIVAFGIPTVAAFCCGAMSVASNSRLAPSTALHHQRLTAVHHRQLAATVACSHT